MWMKIIGKDCFWLLCEKFCVLDICCYFNRP